MLGVAEYFPKGTAAAAAQGDEIMSFLKSRPNGIAPDRQWRLNGCMSNDHGRDIVGEKGFMSHFILSRRQSRGSILAKTSNVRERAAPGAIFFAVPDDLRVMRDGLRSSRYRGAGGL